MKPNVLYQDHTVLITDTYLTIFKYYFPLATSKTILLKQIQLVSIEDAAEAAHKWGICTRYMNNWFPFDTKRKDKKNFISIQIKGKTVRPSFTPNDAQKVFNLIWQNFTQEGKRVVQYRSSQAGKQTQIAQQQVMERMKEQQQQKQMENTKNAIVTKEPEVVQKIQQRSPQKQTKFQVVKITNLEQQQDIQ